MKERQRAKDKMVIDSLATHGQVAQLFSSIQKEGFYLVPYGRGIRKPAPSDSIPQYWTVNYHGKGAVTQVATINNEPSGISYTTINEKLVPEMQIISLRGVLKRFTMTPKMDDARKAFYDLFKA